MNTVIKWDEDKFGIMNSGIIYSTLGGLEDWSYASSWEKDITKYCDIDDSYLGKMSVLNDGINDLRSLC